MPWVDWQFWVVTLAAVASVWMLARVLIPRRRGKRTELTVGGESVGRRRR
jgi:hypothetical protein